MTRTIRERPRRAAATLLALLATVAIGWALGNAAAGHTSARPAHTPVLTRTVTTTLTTTVTRTRTPVPGAQTPSHPQPARRAHHK